MVPQWSIPAIVFFTHLRLQETGGNSAGGARLFMGREGISTLKASVSKLSEPVSPFGP